ncbi:uncharacterized protein LOC132742981 [Ruditapes philippinarum]|uniref:uncharacterized protein LOC132742981 n=1 Tax=Ruditapes philippinarum TaxID=129788 RepID=UPI00295B0E86|nr:uncharacterized protein LOC132742981 [Ruditapes philippinarum]
MVEERPLDRPWLTFFVFVTSFVGFVLEVIAFAYLFLGLCENVPDDRAYCKVDNDSLHDDDDSNDESEGVLSYRGYHLFVGVTVFLELFAVIKVSCKIYCCVKNVWVPRCAKTWRCCYCCGNYWFVMAGLGVCLNILCIISVCMAVPFSDMMDYIVGFRIVFANVWFGFVKLTIWTAYSVYRKSCCPDQAYFLGSNRSLSTCGIMTIHVSAEVNATRRPDGMEVTVDKLETMRIEKI